jgi:hypothetical protein
MSVCYTTEDFAVRPRTDKFGLNMIAVLTKAIYQALLAEQWEVHIGDRLRIQTFFPVSGAAAPGTGLLVGLKRKAES